MLSNQRPQVVDEADRWERLVESGFRDLGLEKLVHEGMEVKAKLNHVDDPLLAKRLDRMLELKACLQEKEFGKPRRLLGAEPSTDDVPLKKKKKRKTKSIKDTTTTSSSSASPAATKKKKLPKKTAKRVSFPPELDHCA